MYKYSLKTTKIQYGILHCIIFIHQLIKQTDTE